MTTIREMVQDHEAIKKLPKKSSYNTVEALCDELLIESYYLDHDKADEFFDAYWLKSWICTDTEVGVAAIYYCGTFVGIFTQTSRKGHYDIHFKSNKTIGTIRSVLNALMNDELRNRNIGIINDDLLDKDPETFNCYGFSK